MEVASVEIMNGGAREFGRGKSWRGVRSELFAGPECGSFGW